MPSRTYTNADADRQYGKGRTEFGPWKPLTRKSPDPYEGLKDIGDIDSIIADAKDTYRRTSGRGAGVLDETLRRHQYDRAEESARAKSNPLSAFVTSVFSPEQRESTARWIEGDARNREGLGNRVRSFVAGAVGGAGEDSEWGGAMGEITPLNVGTGFGITRTGPLGAALRKAREAQAVSGVRAARAARLPRVDGGPDPISPVKIRTLTDRREALDPATWDNLPTHELPERRTMSVFPKRDADVTHMSHREATDPNTWDSVPETGPIATREGSGPPVPGTPSYRVRGRNAVTKNADQYDQTASDIADWATRQRTGELPVLGRPSSPTLPNFDTPGEVPPFEVIDDIATPQVSAADPEEMAGFLNSFMNLRGAGARNALRGEVAPVAAAATEDVAPDINRLRSIFAGERPLPRGGGQRPPQTNPERLLPAFGETHEGMAAQNLGFARRTRTLRPESTTLELANELAQSKGGPEVKALDAYPYPAGDDELSKALRQRAYLSEKSRNVAPPALRDERGFADPKLLGFLGRTGGGAAVGGANPELVGADSENDHLEGAVRGGLFGAIVPDLVRAGGRVVRALPQGLKATGRQLFDEVQGLRYMGALSGRAVPKSIAGNVAAPFWAGAEKGSMAPIKEFFKPETVKTWFRELRNPTREGMTLEQQDSPNIFGRILGAGDRATTEALERGGLSHDEAARHLLRTPTGELGITGPTGDLLRSRAGRAALMFQTTPANQIVHGGRAIAGLEGNRARALAGVAGAAGLAHGSMEDSDPIEIAMASPLAGVYSAPYLLGAGMGKLARGSTSVATGVLRGVSPVPELGRDIIDPRRFARPITDPAIGAWFNEERRVGRSTTPRAKRAARRPQRRTR